MDPRGRGTNERRVPSTLEEAYESHDAWVKPEDRDHYQAHVCRLRAEDYRSRGIRTGESVRRRERGRAEARRAEEVRARRPWWRRVLGGRKQ